MVSFKELKKNSGNLEQLAKELEKTQSNKQDSNKDDDTYWKPTVDKAGNAFAVIRFLPAPFVDGDEGTPWVRVFDHGFKGPGGWYIENSLTTLGQADPVSELNTKLWNSGIESNKQIARDQKRRLKYHLGIYVISDKANPEAEGKAWRFKVGKKIFEKIVEKMHPQFEDEKPFNPFDFWTGANFKLKVRKVEGYQNYDKSEFDTPSALFDGDEKRLEALWKSQYSLKELVDPKKFKSYEELKIRLQRVLGAPSVPEEENYQPVEEEEKPTPRRQVVETPPADDDDEALRYFENLADDEK